jgi:hypothetical protein
MIGKTLDYMFDYIHKHMWVGLPFCVVVTIAYKALKYVDRSFRYRVKKAS